MKEDFGEVFYSKNGAMDFKLMEQSPYFLLRQKEVELEEKKYCLDKNIRVAWAVLFYLLLAGAVYIFIRMDALNILVGLIQKFIGG